MTDDVLIIFATLLEAKNTIEHVKAKKENFFDHSLDFYRFESGGILISKMGILAAQRAVLSYAPFFNEIWNLGFAGNLKENFSIGTVISIKKVGKFLPLSLASEIDSRSFEIAHEIHPVFSINEGSACLASSDFPIYEQKHREWLANDFDLVDMEGYGIAFGATTLGKKYRMWKIVSDFANHKGREEILRNSDFLAEKLALHIEEQICQRL